MLNSSHFALFVATGLHQNQERKRADVSEEKEVKNSVWVLMDFK